MTDQAALASLHRATDWRKSSYSQGANDCVEVSDRVPGHIAIRDSKLGPDSPILTVTTAQWRALLTAIRADELR
jgi:uncharacterized protein DUF397